MSVFWLLGRLCKTIRKESRNCSSFHPCRGNQSDLFVIDVITKKTLSGKLVMGQQGYSLQNTEGLICSSSTPCVCLLAATAALH